MKRHIQLLALLTGALVLLPGAASAYVFELELSGSRYVERGRSALKKGNIKLAIKSYEMGIKGGLGRSDAQDAHNDLCVAYYFLAEYEVALEHCNAAIKMVPNYWVHYNNRANIYLMQGDLERAKKDYRKALRLHPKSDVIEQNMALAQRIEMTRSEAKIRNDDDLDVKKREKEPNHEPSSVALTGMQ